MQYDDHKNHTTLFHFLKTCQSKIISIRQNRKNKRKIQHII